MNGCRRGTNARVISQTKTRSQVSRGVRVCAAVSSQSAVCTATVFSFCCGFAQICTVCWLHCKSRHLPAQYSVICYRGFISSLTNTLFSFLHFYLLVFNKKFFSLKYFLTCFCSLLFFYLQTSHITQSILFFKNNNIFVLKNILF